MKIKNLIDQITKVNHPSYEHFRIDQLVIDLHQGDRVEIKVYSKFDGEYNEETETWEYVENIEESLKLEKEYVATCPNSHLNTLIQRKSEKLSNPL